MSASIVFAKETRTGRVVHIESIVREEKEAYECCGCGVSLTPVKSVARKKDWHFRHKETATIASCRNTALHDYAVQLIFDNKAIAVSKELTISYTNPRKEVPVFSKRSDVTVHYHNVDVHFEVVVTHDIDREKLDLYIQQKIHCVKIDLSEPHWLTASPEAIKDIVLCKHNNKVKIYWPVAETMPPTTKGDDFNLGAIMLGLLGAILFYFAFFNKKEGRY